MTTKARIGTAVSGGVCIVLAALLGVWILHRGVEPFAIDAAWNDVVASISTPVLTGFALVMNAVGGGWIGALVIPLALAALCFFVLRRPWTGAFVLTAEAASAALVQVLKTVFGRARPEEILVLSDYGSFPSGHTANAATLAAIAAVLAPRAWVIVVGAVWTLLMAFSRTYLHAHWLTDTLGGTLVGVGVTLLVAAAFASLLAREAGGAGRRGRPPAAGGSSPGDGAEPRRSVGG